MTDIDGYEDDDYTRDDDWYDDDRYDDRESDPEDADIARSYEEHYEHCERKHGGGECDCRPSRLLLAREAVTRKLWYARGWVRIFAYEMHTVRIGPLELTARFRPPLRCGACSGKGWFYSKTGINPDPMPPGYDGVSLCGCGSAVARLAEGRRTVRQAQKEAPF